MNELAAARDALEAARERWKEAIRARAAAGDSLRSIAAEAGCSHERVRQVLNETKNAEQETPNEGESDA